MPSIPETCHDSDINSCCEKESESEPPRLAESKNPRAQLEAGRMMSDGNELLIYADNCT